MLIMSVFRDDSWSTWKNVEGQTTAIRNHLKLKHGRYWRDMVLLKHLKGWKKLGTSNKDSPSGQHETFSLDGFYDRLTKWIAVDDQVCHVPFLRIFCLPAYHVVAGYR